MIRKLQCWLVSGTAGPSRRQTSLHRIHEYVLHTAWPLDNRCETLQLGSSFCFYSCHLAVVGLGWSQWVNLGTIKGKARVTHIPALTFSCSWAWRRAGKPASAALWNTSFRSSYTGIIFIPHSPRSFRVPLTLSILSMILPDIPGMRLKE